ncbi:hypothetical protein [Methylobacterium sp. 37f]|uniref:hypothetical protein n=1 Tax=Methylobacterium sp. 37f TaxID=2817058 RepID=UPI001FFD4149|nr:hypothetical protein [Methylobacterium sp. 37f]MCK2054063.1 hypothetical protein [Methylobacterium sp. 37f]
MRTPVRVFAALATAIAVGVAVMAHDRQIGAEWAVSREQIADAQAYGKPGVELAPGRMVTEPLPSEAAGRLPLKWILLGLAAGGAVLAGTGRRRPR